MDENILWATAVVDRRAAFDKRQEKRRARAQKLGILIVDASSVVVEGGNESVNQSVANIQGPVEPDEFLKAAAHGKMEVVEKFLEDGGDPNTCDEFRKTALHRAALENHAKIVEKLLDKGADINFKDRLLSSPLHVATRTGHSDVVQHLLTSGININAKDWEGDTALHDAVRLNRYKIVKLLILAGADMQIKNVEGVTATKQVKQWQFDTKETLEKLEQMREVGLA
ncbi:ankyrin repeat domain-containing 2-like protein [Labeo rohita]|uniref:Ankyrin repeat domain-containing 2-like protein n=1 Tax=Labeo rohita TaxID=84645 RepID=A0A498LQ00_LABRO|nr:ankyrin repeat domain-containing 2-like protein [Labeo rohita]